MIINKILTFSFIISVFFTNLIAGEFEDWKKQQELELQASKNEFVEYKKKEDAEFKAYLKAQDEGFKEYKKDIKKVWPNAETTTNHKWVEYSKDYSSKKSIDFQKQEINLEVIATSKKEAKKKIEKLFSNLLKDDVKSAYKNDKLEDKISTKLKKNKQKIISNKKIISDILTKKDTKKIFQSIKKQKFTVVKHKGKFIYKANVKMPKTSMIKKAKTFSSEVNKNAKIQQIPASLIYAIMHSESSFNPMARSHIPAYGLMQVVPRSAGIDSYKYLYGKKKILRPNYLYTSSKNITIGTAYLHILYYRYLKKIKDPMSKMYCTIAAYNTGAGNVAKAFIQTTNINKASYKINSMSSDEVYKHLLRNLPYSETRKYLKKVNTRVSSYHKLIKNNKL